MFSNYDNFLVMKNDTQEIFVEGLKKLFADENRERQKLNQKKLTWADVADGFGTTPANLSSFLALKRNYSESKKQALAHFFGKTYLEVFDLGRGDIGRTAFFDTYKIMESLNKALASPAPISFQDESDKKHQIVIEGFKDKERAIRLNQKLVELEKRDPEKLKSIEDLMDAWLSLAPTKEDSSKKGQSTGTNGVN